MRTSAADSSQQSTGVAAAAGIDEEYQQKFQTTLEPDLVKWRASVLRLSPSLADYADFRPVEGIGQMGMLCTRATTLNQAFLTQMQHKFQNK